MKKVSEIVKEVHQMITPVIKEKELELVDIEYVKEASHWFLRIFIDKPGGVTIDDCEAVSRAMSDMLDEKDPIDDAYTLEVSSPGLDRPLKKEEDFVRFQGEIVDIKLYKALNKQKEFQGVLLGLENGEISIESEEGTILRFQKSEVAIVRLAVIL